MKFQKRQSRQLLALFVFTLAAFGLPGELFGQVETNPPKGGPTTNAPPRARIVSPLDGARFAAPANIVLIAHAEDIGDQVSTVEFFEGTNSLGVTTNLPVANPIGPCVLVSSDVGAGEYTLTRTRMTLHAES